jgi:hypothetical protein
LSKSIDKRKKEIGLMLNGNGALDTSTHRATRRVREELSRKTRFELLATAVADHGARVKASTAGWRPHDRALYRRLREISIDAARPSSPSPR